MGTKLTLEQRQARAFRFLSQKRCFINEVDNLCTGKTSRVVEWGPEGGCESEGRSLLEATERAMRDYKTTKKFCREG